MADGSIDGGGSAPTDAGHSSDVIVTPPDGGGAESSLPGEDAAPPVDTFEVEWTPEPDYPDADLIAAFNAAYNQKRIPTGEVGAWYADVSNQDALLANNHPAVMLALLAMHTATGEVSYLHAFVKHADAVLAWRDDATGFTDWQGGSNAVWANRNYNDSDTDTRAYPYAFESGVLTYPIAEFAQRILWDLALQNVTTHGQRTLKETAVAYRSKVAETLQYHQGRWHTQEPFTSTVNGKTYDYRLAWFSGVAEHRLHRWAHPRKASSPQYERCARKDDGRDVARVCRRQRVSSRFESRVGKGARLLRAGGARVPRAG